MLISKNRFPFWSLFFLVYLLIYGQRSIPFSLYYSVKHLSLSILLGFILLKLKVGGSGSWRYYFEGRGVHLKEKGMLPHLFSRFTLPLLKKNKQQPSFLTFFLFQYFLGVCIYNISLKDWVDPSFVGPATNWSLKKCSEIVLSFIFLYHMIQCIYQRCYWLQHLKSVEILIQTVNGVCTYFKSFILNEGAG